MNWLRLIFKCKTEAAFLRKLCCNEMEEVSQGLAWLTAMAYKHVAVRAQQLVRVHRHTHTQGQRHIGCHSDCHEGDKLCQVLSLCGPTRRGGDEHTLIQWHKHTHSNLEVAYWQRQRQVCMQFYSTHAHTVKRCFWRIQQSRAHQGARKLFDSRSLFSQLPLNICLSTCFKDAMESDWVYLIFAKYSSWHKSKRKRELAIVSSLVILKPWGALIPRFPPAVTYSLYLAVRSVKQVYTNSSRHKQFTWKLLVVQNVLLMFPRTFLVLQKKKIVLRSSFPEKAWFLLKGCGRKEAQDRKSTSLTSLVLWYCGTKTNCTFTNKTLC